MAAQSGIAPPDRVYPQSQPEAPPGCATIVRRVHLLFREQSEPPTSISQFRSARRSLAGEVQSFRGTIQQRADIPVPLRA
jgi:hypothetical protein